jgi:hypothetical protein
LARESAGSKSAASMAMIAITTNNSISVNASLLEVISIFAFPWSVPILDMDMQG